MRENKNNDEEQLQQLSNQLEDGIQEKRLVTTERIKHFRKMAIEMGATEEEVQTHFKVEMLHSKYKAYKETENLMNELKLPKAVRESVIESSTVRIDYEMQRLMDVLKEEAKRDNK